MILLIIVALSVIVASALCSGSEAAFLSISTMRVKQLTEEGNKSAKKLLHLKENDEKTISAIVVLNNIANIVGSLIVGGIAAEIFSSFQMGIFSAVLTGLIILFSEIIPKTLGARYAEGTMLLFSRPLSAIVFIFTPLLWALEKFTKLFLGTKEDTFSTSEGEITFMVRQGGKEGAIDEDEAVMLQRVFMMDDLSAKDIMTPRTQMTYLRTDRTLKEHEYFIRNAQHSRFVIIGETLDEIIGVSLSKDLLLRLLENNDDTLSSDKSYVNPAQFVSPDMKSDDLLQLFMRERNHLALVRDQFGMVLGVVTLEDVLEILTGEIVDETDQDVDLQKVALEINGN